MFNFLKKKKDHDSVAKSIWGLIGGPIAVARMQFESKNPKKDFISHFFAEDYLAAYFNMFISKMGNFFFPNYWKTPMDKGLVILKIHEILDSRFKDNTTVEQHYYMMQTKTSLPSGIIQEAADHTEQVLCILTNVAEKQFPKDKIYIKAKEFYETGKWKEREKLNKKVLNLPSRSFFKINERRMAIAYRFFEYTFVFYLDHIFQAKWYFGEDLKFLKDHHGI